MIDFAGRFVHLKTNSVLKGGVNMAAEVNVFFIESVWSRLPSFA